MAIVLAIKIGFLSTAVLLSLVVMLNLLSSTPQTMLESALSEFPSFYASVLSWLQPPYLYILINAIILSIVASSKLRLNSELSKQVAEPVITQVPPPVPANVAYDNYNDVVLSSNENVYDTSKIEAHDDVVSGFERDDEEDEVEKVVMDSGDEVRVQSKSRWTSPQREDSLVNESCEKPPVSSRLSRQKSIKATPEGKLTLGVSKPRKQDTLETTWRAITEGRAMPLTRHLKKSETWDTHPQNQEDCTVPTMKKAETFNERSSSKPPLNRTSGKVMTARREPSLSQDELNKRVEAFIKKFNEDMRLQRQESLDRYREMVSHGGAVAS